MKTPTATHSLHRRLALLMGSFAIVLAGMFSGLSLLFIYVIEDEFFTRELWEEAQHMRRIWEQEQRMETPRREHIRLYASAEQFPPDLLLAFNEAPREMEYAGDAERHYHVMKVDLGSQHFLVAEVSERLLIRKIREELLWFLLLVSSVLTILAAALGVRFARHLTRPLADLADEIDRSEGGELPNAFAAQYPPNEIGTLAHALETSMQRINAFVQRELDFTRDASHELRTPTTIIRGANELLQANPSLDANARAQCLRIESAALQMQETIQLLLELAREEGQQDSSHDVKLLGLVEQAVIDNSRFLDGKNVEVDITVSASCTIRTRETVLRLLLNNLVGNACQYTPGGWIRVEGDHKRLSIANSTGEDKDGGGRAAADQISYGFGMNIVRRLCEHQGWQVEWRSDGDSTHVQVDFSNNT